MSEFTFIALINKRPILRTDFVPCPVPFFTICDCSEFEPNAMASGLAQLCTPFLQRVQNCIDFMEPLGRTITGRAYKIMTELPDDKDAPEVQLCLDFLTIKDSGWSLWGFITSFLGIGDNHDYLLMNYLDHKGYTAHGAGIRASWLADKGRVPDPGNIERITHWLQTVQEPERPWLQGVQC